MNAGPSRDTSAKPRRHAVALMYHALSQGDAPAGQDPHYTLEAATFRRQLDAMAARGGATSARDWLHASGRGPTLLLTFDDGHASNHRIAFPALVERDMRADFFVNPANVGTPGFAGWADLREMAAAGMSIQSHGNEHVYLTGLDARTLRDSLHASKQAIEEKIGAPVTLLAPPGGRMPPGLADLAHACGYRQILSSRPGRMPSTRRATAGSRTAGILPRMSVTSALDEAHVLRWFDGDTGAMARECLRYGALAAAKRLLGNARYERIRGRALSGRGG